MHSNVINFVKGIQREFPNYFNNSQVLECGSLNINGSNRIFFKNCKYKGLDIVKGKDVDIVTKTHAFLEGVSKIYDVVISTEMLEHDKFYSESLQTMFRLTKSNGLLLVTAAGEGRKEHGTTATSPADSPLTNDYYKNITVSMLQEGLDFSEFKWFTINYQLAIGDIQFAGIKK